MKAENVPCLCEHPRWLHKRRDTPNEYEECRAKGCICTHYMPPEDSGKTVKMFHPHAHCAPLAHAMYPEFYVIRASNAEWAETLGSGPTPHRAWDHAKSQLQTGMEQRMEGHLEDRER